MRHTLDIQEAHRSRNPEMPRFFRNGKCWPLLVLLAALPSASAWPTSLEFAPGLEGDSLLPETFLSDAIRTAPPPEVDGILVGRLVNLTLDYAAELDPDDNATEQQQKAQAYLHAMELVVKEFLPPAMGWCLDWTPGGLAPGPGRTHVHDTLSPLPVALVHYFLDHQQSPSVLC